MKYQFKECTIATILTVITMQICYLLVYYIPAVNSQECSDIEIISLGAALMLGMPFYFFILLVIFIFIASYFYCIMMDNVNGTEVGNFMDQTIDVITKPKVWIPALIIYLILIGQAAYKIYKMNYLC